MQLVDYITIGAIFLGPIASIQIQKFLEYRKQSKNEKIHIFRTLMGTRGSNLSTVHVEALNQIDLVFEKKKYQAVRMAWGEYLDNLNRGLNNDNLSVWAEKNEDLLANLLYEMGLALGHNYDKVTIKRNSYTPVGYSNVENENQHIRTGLIDILERKRSVPMHIVKSKEEYENEQKLQGLLVQYFESKIKKSTKKSNKKNKHSINEN